MVNRFTQKAQAVLTNANKCSRELGSSYIGTEHLLLGILKTDCIGCKLLNDKRIFYNDVLDKIIDFKTDNLSKGHENELSPKCKNVIEGASIVAKRFSSKFIGSEHLLYSICEQNECYASKILISLEISLSLLKITIYINKMIVAPKALSATICIEDNPKTFIVLTNIPSIPHKHAAIIIYAEPNLSLIINRLICHVSRKL